MWVFKCFKYVCMSSTCRSIITFTHGMEFSEPSFHRELDRDDVLVQYDVRHQIKHATSPNDLPVAVAL